VARGNPSEIDAVSTQKPVLVEEAVRTKLILHSVNSAAVYKQKNEGRTRSRADDQPAAGQEIPG